MIKLSSPARDPSPRNGCKLDRKDECESEERIITSVANNVPSTGLCTVYFSHSLKYDHLGVTHSSGGQYIDMRAEVLHLSRNAGVRGREDALLSGLT